MARFQAESCHLAMSEMVRFQLWQGLTGILRMGLLRELGTPLFVLPSCHLVTEAGTCSDGS